MILVIIVIIIYHPHSKLITDFELHLSEPDDIALLILIDAALVSIR